jgi:peptidoglycan LD-endopeptidase CwlK
MSAIVAPEDVKFTQRLLRMDGLYTGPVNGTWDDATEAAAQIFEAESARLRAAMRAFDTLHAQREARLFLGRLIDAGARAKIISGTRTYAEQDRLFAQGRFGNSGKIVTKAEGGHSNHNFGVAWDVGLFTAGGAYLEDSGPYVEAAAEGKVAELEWGGDWTGFRDTPHYQLKLRTQSIAELRERFESGSSQSIFNV